MLKISLIAVLVALTSSLSFAQTTTAPAATTAAPAASSAAKVSADEPAVKKSKNNICHDKTSSGYKQTKNFTPFNTMDECVKSGGRPPKSDKK
jgi:microcystin-dependent protein